MWIIIAGIRDVERDLEATASYCPQCGTDTPCTRRKVTRYLTVFFLPLIPLGARGEILKCDRCGARFDAGRAAAS